MSTESGRRAPGTLTCLLAVMLGACGEAAPPAEQGASDASPPVLAAPAEPEPQTILDIFPDDAARVLVLDNCSSCHAVACAAMGQRTAGRWNGLREGHVEHVAGLPSEDVDAIFAYLQSNFSDQQPEPMIPPRFLEGGCTPF